MPFSKHALRTVFWLALFLSARAAIQTGAQTKPASSAFGALSVKVVDAVNDLGVTGAKLQIVTAGERPHLTGNWTTDPTGTTSLPFPVSTGSELKFWTIADNYVPAETEVQRNLLGTFPDACTVRLERAVPVGGVVLNETGEPVPGVEVFVEWGKKSESRDPTEIPASNDHFHYEKTDAKGRWTCRHAARPLQSARFRFIHPDYVTVIGAPNAAELQQDNVTALSESSLLSSAGVVIMKHGLALKGVVLDSRQKPIEGAEVTAGDYPVWTPADGRFSFNNRPAGETFLSVEAKGFAPRRMQIRVRKGMDEARLELQQGHCLKLRVLDAQGRPVSGARIAAEKQDDQSPSQRAWETDAEGRLIWNSAPAQDGVYTVSHFGYETAFSQPLKADGTEQVITLQKHLQISGRVVDFQTKAPITAFRVIPGVFHLDHYDWNHSLASSAQNGAYAVSLPKSDLPHLVRIEADGFYPEISRTFLESEQDAVADVALHRGDPIRGTVQDSRGKPVARAQVALCLEDQMTLLAEARFADVYSRLISETDAQGRFLLQPQHGVKMIAASHELGYAEISMEDFEHSKIIRLNPWGRITGALNVGAALGTNQLVQLIRIGSFSPRFQVNSFTALTDSQGRFDLQHVPPGPHIIGRLIGSQFSHGQTIKVVAGETTQVVLGVGGRTVTGSIVAADGRKLDWQTGYQPAFLRAKLPPLAIPRLADGLATNAWLRTYWDSERGRARQISDVSYVLQFESSNVFHAENVPPGDYECEIHYHEPSPRDNEPDNCLGILRKEVVIPELPPGRLDEPFNFGRVTITLNPSAQ